MSKVALIRGTTRSPSVGGHVAAWVHDVLKTRPSDNLTIEPVAIADFNLPVYDEPVVPAMVPAAQQFTKEHSKKWSAAIASFQGPNTTADCLGGQRTPSTISTASGLGSPSPSSATGLRAVRRPTSSSATVFQR
jgi:hypothetical protein